MRWQRLFEDIERRSFDEELLERDELISDLREAEFRSLTWTDMLGGDLVLDIRGIGTIDSQVRQVGSDWLVLSRPSTGAVIRHEAVASVRGVGRRTDARVVAPEHYRWQTLVRAMGDEGALRLVRMDGSVVVGDLVATGQDMILVALPDQSHVMTVWSHVAAVHPQW